MIDIIAPESPIFTSVVTDSNTTCTLYWEKDSTGLSSGRFGYANVYIQAPRHVDVKIKLDAKRDKSGNVNLNWKYDYQGDVPHWGVIYRSVDGGDYQAIASFKEGDKTYTDNTLPAKAKAEYYILLQLGHGSTSSPSNTAAIK